MLIGPDAAGAGGLLPLPVLRADLRPGPEVAAFVGRRVLAFAGIARPEKFFAMLAEAGVVVAGNDGRSRITTRFRRRTCVA